MRQVTPPVKMDRTDSFKGEVWGNLLTICEEKQNQIPTFNDIPE